MPRQVTHGTPSLSTRYMRPRKNRIARWSAAAAVALIAILVGAYAAGRQTGTSLIAVASPGTVAAGHASIDARCAQCHEPSRGAPDLRCERCHDPIDTRRLENGSHALVSGSNAWHAMKDPVVSCGTCHDEHRGHAKPLATVDDRRCSMCHDFASFNRHPEFAVVRARRGPDEGMEFSHAIHLREVTKAGGERCSSCHVPTANQAGFDPITFDAHCSRCHIKDGVLTIDGVNPLVSGSTPEDLLLPGMPALPRPRLSAPDSSGRVTFQAAGHRDPWVVANIDRLSRALSSASIANARARLESRRARLNAIVNAAPLPQQPDRDLTAWRDELRRDRTAPSTAFAGDVATVPGIEAGLASLAAQVAATPGTVGASAAAPADAAAVAERRQEIQALLDAVSARANGGLAQRADALRKRLATIRADAAPPKPYEGVALGELLNDVDSALAALAPSLRTEDAQAVASMRDAVRRQLAGGADQTGYASLRKQLLDALEALPSGVQDAGPRARVGELRAAIASLPGSAFMDRTRDRARLLERLETEIALRPEGNQAAPFAADSERAEARRQLQIVTQQLAAIGDAGTLPAADLARARPALLGVVGACVACHRLNEDETGLRPTALNGPVMPDARYSHRPHILQQGCETCHNTIQGSRSASDANIPGVATCQGCHKPSQAKPTCGECHSYHPRSSADLIMAAVR